MLAFFIEIDNFGICMGVDRFGINRVFFLSKSTRILVTNKTYFFRRKIIQFFFPRKWKKNTADFTLSFLLPGYSANCNFSREKNTTSLVHTTHQLYLKY